MPTGYTAILIKKPETTFEEFALRCARNFGACIMQRDDGLDAPLVVEEQPSDHHSNGLNRAVTRINWIATATDADLEKEQNSLIEETREQYQRFIEESSRALESLIAMRAEVLRWNPPTTGHFCLKKFMVQQLDETIKFDGDASYYRDELRKVASIPVSEYRSVQMQKALESASYHKAEHAKEVERVNARNEWTRQLVESLKRGGE